MAANIIGMTRRFQWRCFLHSTVEEAPSWSGVLFFLQWKGCAGRSTAPGYVEMLQRAKDQPLEMAERPSHLQWLH